MPSQHAAFVSYVRFNDQHDNRWISQFCERLSGEVRAQIAEEFSIFQDRKDIAWGQNWQQRIDQALDAATLLLVIITPAFFRSGFCRKEVERFLERERTLGRQDLILPVYYISAREIDDPGLRESDQLAQVLASRQYDDWQELRFEPLTLPKARKAVAKLANRMRDTFWRSIEDPSSGPRERVHQAPERSQSIETVHAVEAPARVDLPAHVAGPPAIEPDVQLVPVLENIGTDTPFLAAQEIIEYLPVSRQHLRGDHVFALRVKGNFMIGDGVLYGDYVFVVRDPSPKDGDMVVALMEDEVAVKRLWREDDTIRLESSNQFSEPLIYGPGDELMIQGRVIGVVRWHVKNERRR